MAAVFDCNLRHDFCRQRPTLLGRWVGRVGGWVVFLCLASKVVSTQADRKRNPGRSPACTPPVCRRDPHPSCRNRLQPQARFLSPRIARCQHCWGRHQGPAVGTCSPMLPANCLHVLRPAVGACSPMLPACLPTHSPPTHPSTQLSMTNVGGV